MDLLHYRHTNYDVMIFFKGMQKKKKKLCQMYDCAGLCGRPPYNYAGNITPEVCSTLNCCAGNVPE